MAPPKTDAVVWATVPGHIKGCWDGQYRVSYSMWEATRLPELFRCKFHEFDLIIVPCEQNREMFAQYHDNVVKVPLGYDSDVWKLLDRIYETTFYFLVGATGKRKGYDLIAPAFERAFPHWERMDPQPRVIVKAIQFPINAPWAENHIGGRPVEEVVELYRKAHVMLMPSRGEGWGYHPQQAVATGIPAICSEIPAHMEYATLPGFLTVPTTIGKAEGFMYGEAGEWWEPDPDALVAAMREVYDNYHHWMREAWVGSKVITECNHKRMAERLLAKIPTEAREIGDWVSFREQEFEVEVNRYIDCTIGEGRYSFRPGYTYWAPADVRRVLWEAGYLTSACKLRDRGRVVG